jgi:hypothetical protein
VPEFKLRSERLSLPLASANVLWARPGLGAWRINMIEGGLGDADERSNFSIELPASRFEPLIPGLAPPETFEPDDVLIVVSRLDVMAARVRDLLADHAAERVQVTIANDVVVNSAQATTVDFVVRLSAPVPHEVTVRYATDHTRFLALGTLVFAPGQTEQTIAVPIILPPAGTHRFLLELSDPRGASLAFSRALATVVTPSRRRAVGR